MKKITFLFAFLLLLTIGKASFALLPGVGLQYTYNSINDKLVTESTLFTITTKTKTPYHSIGVFADLTYLRASLNYSFLGGDSKSTTSSTLLNTSIDTTTDNSKNATNYLVISALGKYPISLINIINIWPAIGLSYDILLSQKINDSNFEKSEAHGNDAASDLYGLIGLGADVNITSNIFVTASYIFGYNFMPNKSSNDLPSSMTMSTMKHSFSFGAGYKL